MPRNTLYNFSAGPAVLPGEVLQETREALLDLAGSGIGIMEHSHRGAAFGAVYEETLERCRRLAQIPGDYELLLLQGGASTQFFMLPANYLAKGSCADYLVTGSWAEKAAAQARFFGEVHEAWKALPYTRIPAAQEIAYSDAPAYVHFTSNNTIFGTQWQSEPTPPAGAWLACDASSDIFSKPLELGRYGLLYAGAQKNLGPAGVTLVALRKELLAPGARVRELPAMQCYERKDGSLYNTPNTFGIYVMGRVLAWIERQGGLAVMAERNREKAAVLYDALDALQGFYTCKAAADSRSQMNVTFGTPSEALDRAFLEAAEAAGFSGLRGHRAVGGMRASIYNAFPIKGCRALADFLHDFAKRKG